MAYKAPTAAEISQSLRQEIRAELPETDPFVWPNNLYVVTKMIAQALRGLYLRLEWLHRQAFASTADGVYLDTIGADTGIARRAAAIAIGSVSATTTAGTIIPPGTRLLRGDNAVFVTTGEGFSNATTTVLPVRALLAGKAGNTDAGAAMRLEAPIDGVSAIVVAADGIIGGAAIESDASYRARILHRRQNPPRGGSPAEYIGWTMGVAGVTRVFVRRATPHAGSVTVFFMMDDKYENGIPQAADIARVRAWLQARAPASADIVVRAPTALPVDVEVTGLVPNVAAVREAVTAEIRAMFRRRAEPGTATEDFVFAASWISEAVSAAAGERRHRLTDPTDDIDCGDGVIATVGTISFG